MEIRRYLQASIKGSNQTKDLEICAISRDKHKNHCYFVFVKVQKKRRFLYPFRRLVAQKFSESASTINHDLSYQSR